MKSFSPYFRIIAAQKTIFIMYLVIFSGISIIFSMLAPSESNDASESAFDANFSIIDRDTNPQVATGLRQYLAQYATDVALKDETEAMQDAIYYRQINAIFIVPRGFSASLASSTPSSESPKIGVVMRPNNAVGYYLERLSTQYIGTVKTYSEAGLNKEGSEQSAHLSRLAQQDLDHRTKLTVKHFGEDNTVAKSLFKYFTILPYGLLLLVVTVIGMFLIVLEEPYLLMRHRVSPRTPMQESRSRILFSLFCAVFVWLLLSALGLAINITGVSQIDLRTVGLILLNSFTFTTFGLMLALLISAFVTNMAALNPAVNSIALTLSFLGGVFMPLKFMGENITKISALLPSYWHTRALEEIQVLNSFAMADIQKVLVPIGIQLCFSFTLMLTYLATMRIKQSGNIHMSTQTKSK